MVHLRPLGFLIQRRKHLHIKIIWKKLYFLKLWRFFHQRCQSWNASFRHFSRWFLSHIAVFIADGCHTSLYSGVETVESLGFFYIRSTARGQKKWSWPMLLSLAGEWRLTAVPATAVGQARASSHGQHRGCLVHQPVGRYTITQLACHLLLWRHMQFKSLRAVHIPGKLNRADDTLSWQLTSPGEWRLYPKTIRLIWSRFGEAQMDLFASHESFHCHWIVDAVALAYQSQGEPCPLGGVRGHSPSPGIRASFSPPVQFPGRWTLVESSKHPLQLDWAEQSDARPSTGVNSPGSPVSPCTGLGVRMAWFPFG